MSSFLDKYQISLEAYGFGWESWVRKVYRAEVAALAVHLSTLPDHQERFGDYRVTYRAMMSVLNGSGIPDIENMGNSHETVACVNALTKALSCKGFADVAHLVHFGLTSSDVGDSAFAMMLKGTFLVLSAEVQDLAMAVKGCTEQWKDTQIIGRTHGQFAEKVSLGRRFDVMGASLVEASAQLQTVTFYGKFSGSMGNYAHTSLERERLVCELLHLHTSRASTQCVPRRLFLRYAFPLLELSTCLEQIAMDLRLMLRSEGELIRKKNPTEPHSSSMPHKTNPFELERVSGMMRVNRAMFQALSENAGVLWEERDMSHSVAEKSAFEMMLSNLFYCTDLIERNIGLLDINVHTAVRHHKVLDSGSLDGQFRMNAAITDGAAREEAYAKEQQPAQ